MKNCSLEGSAEATAFSQRFRKVFNRVKNLKKLRKKVITPTVLLTTVSSCFEFFRSVAMYFFQAPIHVWVQRFCGFFSCVCDLPLNFKFRKYFKSFSLHENWCVQTSCLVIQIILTISLPIKMLKGRRVIYEP